VTERSVAERSVTHDTFVIERTYDASPARVFSAFANPEIKSRWFAGPEEWEPDEREMDFRIGGREVSRGGPKGGPVITFEARYNDIVPNQRIVFTYDMYLDDARMSVSMTTVQLERTGRGTRLIFTEHDALLDGLEAVGPREQGTRHLLEALGRELAREAAPVG
jgi:uncharacterized protein YndB with AHSA1/START domain